MIKNPKQLGFTLIELMISLVLGLLVSAIAINIFFFGAKKLYCAAGNDESSKLNFI